MKAVQEYLKELLENTDQKLLVFAHHKDLLDGVEFVMNKYASALKLHSSTGTFISAGHYLYQ